MAATKNEYLRGGERDEGFYLLIACLTLPAPSVAKFSDYPSFQLECQDVNRKITDIEAIDVGNKTVTVKIGDLAPSIYKIRSYQEYPIPTQDKFGNMVNKMILLFITWGELDGRDVGLSRDIDTYRWRSHHQDDLRWNCAAP